MIDWVCKGLISAGVIVGVMWLLFYLTGSTEGMLIACVGFLMWKSFMQALRNA